MGPNCQDCFGYRLSFAKLNWLFLIVLVYLLHVLWYFDRPVAADAVTTYFPYAQQILEKGLDFFLQEESIAVSPMAYLWPALFGGNVVAVKCANLIVGILMVVLTYGIGLRLHSKVTGLIAAFFFAISPFLIRWIPTGLSEPQFFLFTLIFLWGSGEVLAGKKWAIPVAGLALGFSIMARGVWLYPSIMGVICMLLWGLAKPEQWKVVRNLTTALALGLIMPMLIIIKNKVLFGVLQMDTGAGWALFLGSNIMTNGFEPPLLGLNYESIGSDPHSVIGNKEHAIWAWQFLKEKSLLDFWNWYITKVSWVTLFTPIEMPKIGSLWRIVELATALTGILWGWRTRNALILFVGGATFLQIFQTAFVLYNFRYSAGNLELFLIPLSATGITVVATKKGGGGEALLSGGAMRHFFVLNLYKFVCGSLALFLCLVLYFRDVPTINLPDNIPATVLFEVDGKAITNSVKYEHLNSSAQYLELSVPVQERPAGGGSAIWQIRMRAMSGAGQGECNNASFKFISNTKAGLHESGSIAISRQYLSHFEEFWFKSLQNQSTENGEAYFKIYVDGRVHTYLLGTAISGAELFPVESGKLIIKFDCPLSVKIEVDQLSLVAPHLIEVL